MSRRVLRAFIVLSLVLSAFAGSTLTGSASDHEDRAFAGSADQFLPWVPNGAMISDQREGIGSSGPYSGSVTVQNLEAESTTVTYLVTSTGHSGQIDLEAWGSATLTVDDLFADADIPGSGVWLYTIDGAEITAVQKQSAPGAPDDEARTDTDTETVSGYTALATLADESVLPIVQTNSNWNTLIRMTNFGNQTAEVTVTLYPSDTLPPRVFEREIAVGQTSTIDLLASGVPEEWVGSARISADEPVGAVAERVKNLTSMLIMNVAQPIGDHTIHYAPLVFRDWNHWNTGISVVNLTESINFATVAYFDLDGQFIDADIMTIPANGMKYVYAPAEAGEGFVGSAIITGEAPIHGAVDEVKYTDDGLDAGHATSYLFEREPARMGQSLSLALFQSGDETGLGDTTGIQLFNPSSEWIAAAVRFIDPQGDEVFDPVTVHLEGREGYTVYPYQMPDFPAGFQGSVMVQVYAGNGQLMAIANNVNYQVQDDGSASFNLAVAGNIGPPPPERVLIVEPKRSTSEVQDAHSLTATLLFLGGTPVEGERVTVVATHSDPDEPVEPRTLQTDEDGRVMFDGEFSRALAGIETFAVLYPEWDPDDPDDGQLRIQALAWNLWTDEGGQSD